MRDKGFQVAVGIAAMGCLAILGPAAIAVVVFLSDGTLLPACLFAGLALVLCLTAAAERIAADLRSLARW
jgi:hypothetical protein